MKGNEKNLKYSINDGIASSAMLGFGEKFVSPYAIALGANNTEIGKLTSIPQLVGAFSQLFSAKLAEKFRSRKKMILVFSFIQAFIWLPIGFLMFIENPISKLILFFTFYVLCNSIIDPAWSSWMGDLVPDKTKGHFFGKRRKFAGISFFISGILAGYILFFSSKFHPLLGFGIIFFVAFISRYVSWTYLKKIDEPEYYVREEDQFSIIDFVKKMGETNFGRFVIYLFFLTFSVNLAAPFFTVYMLKDLGFSYSTYTLITSISTISNFFFIAVWGKYSDLFGNKTIMRITGFMVPLIPFLWIFSSDPIYLMIIEVFSGFAWSGFNIASFNFIFDTVSPSKRVRCVSYYNALNGLAIFLGATLGSFLIRFGWMFRYNFILLLIVSGIGRFIASAVMLPKIKEVKWTKTAPEQKILISVVTEAFGGLKYPVLLLQDKRIVIKRKSRFLIKKINSIMQKAFGVKNKYS